MKKVDLKSMVIGMMFSAFVLVALGSSQIGTIYDNLIVRQITIVNDNGQPVGVISDGFVRTYNSDGKETGYFGTDDDGNGVMMTFNSNENLAVYAGTGSESGGMVILIILPSLDGLSPRSEDVIAFSILRIAPRSQGWITRSLASGTEIPAI